MYAFAAVSIAHGCGEQRGHRAVANSLYSSHWRPLQGRLSRQRKEKGINLWNSRKIPLEKLCFSANTKWVIRILPPPPRSPRAAMDKPCFRALSCLESFLLSVLNTNWLQFKLACEASLNACALDRYEGVGFLGDQLFFCNGSVLVGLFLE